MSLEIVLPDTHSDKYPHTVNTISKYKWYRYIFRYQDDEGIAMIVPLCIAGDGYVVLVTIDSYGNSDAFDISQNRVIEGFRFMNEPLPNGTKISFVIGE